MDCPVNCRLGHPLLLKKFCLAFSFSFLSVKKLFGFLIGWNEGIENWLLTPKGMALSLDLADQLSVVNLSVLLY